jgi:uncharacterized membrane protein YvlD (DUF360 family)
MNWEWLKNFRPTIIIFIILSAFFISGKAFLEKKGFNQDVLLVGNLFLFAVTALSFWMMANGMKTKNTSAFLRGVYGGIMLKLFSCLIAAFVYIMTMKKEVNKPGLFLCMGLYIVYTFIEVKALMKLSSSKKDA